MKLSVILAIALIPAFASNSAAQESRRYIKPSSVADSTALPFSGGVLVGNTLYLSGAIGIDEERQVPDTAEEEARNVLNAVRETLEAAEF